MTLVLCLATEPIERLAVDVAVVPIHEGDRPLRGAAGRVDWRLCGRLSKLIDAGRVQGVAGEAVLIPSTGGLRAPLVVALGQGPRGAVDAERCAKSAAEALERGVGLGGTRLAVALFDSDCGVPALEERLEAALVGFERALERLDDASDHGDSETSLVLVLGVGEEHAAAQWLGKALSRHSRPGIDVRISSPEPGRATRASPRGASPEATRGLPAVK